MRPPLKIRARALGFVFFLVLSASVASASQFGAMFLSEQAMVGIANWIDALPEYPAAPESALGLTGNASVLGHLHYTPELREQKPTGTCWIWSSTAVMSIDFDIQFGGNPVVQEGLSVQFLASNAWMVGSDLNRGGHAGLTKEFYDMIGYAVPSANTNAMWNMNADGTEIDESFGIRPAAWIHSGTAWNSANSTEINYPIEKIEENLITTFPHGNETVSKAQAIANIKQVLDEGRPVWFLYFLPTTADWDQFDEAWATQTEDTVMNLDYGKGHTWDEGGCGHAVVCVGYNDSDPNNRYWEILNTHGTAGGRRPNVVFRLSMDIDYNARFVGAQNGIDTMYNWVSMKTTFRPKGTTVANPKGVKSLVVGTNTGSKTASGSILVNSAGFEGEIAGIASANLVVNYKTFPCDSTTGTWKKTASLWQFKSKVRSTPSVTVTIDTRKKCWSASVLHADLNRVVNPGDGIRCKLEYKESAEDAQSMLLSGVASVYDMLPARTSATIKGP